MALAVPAALKKLLGSGSSAAPTAADSTGSSGETWGKDNPYGLPADMPKNYGVTDDWSGGEPKGTYGPVDRSLKTAKTTDTPPAISKLFGPAVNPTDQAAAEAQDPTGASASIRPKESLEGLQKPQENAGLKQSLIQAAKAAPLYAQPVSPKDVVPVEQAEAPAAATPNSPSEVASLAPSKPTDAQLPELAPQGSTHAVPHALLELMGMVGPQPKAGEVYKGPTSLADKIRAGIGFAAKLGNAGAAAAGTPEQQQMAEKRAEFGPELAQKGELARAQIKSLGDYRVGRLQNATDANDIKQQQADQTHQIALGKLDRLGYVPDPNAPGGFRPKTLEELSQDPRIATDMTGKTLINAVRQADADEKRVRTQTMLTGNTKAGELAQQQIDLKREQIHAQMMILGHKLANEDAGLRIRRQEMKLNYGVDELGNRLEDDPNVPSEMMKDPSTGLPTPYKMNSVYGPTSQMKTRGQMATTMPSHITEMQNLIHEASQRGYVGPASGRIYQDFLAGKVGSTGDPQADELLGQLNAARTFLASGVNVMHYGGKGGQSSYEKFEEMLGKGASEANLNGALHEIAHYGEGYAGALPKAVGGGHGGSPTTAPAAPTTKIPTFSDWQKTQKKPQGGQ